MSTYKEKEPDKDIKLSKKTKLKDKPGQKKETNPIVDDKTVQSQDNKEQDPSDLEKNVQPDGEGVKNNQPPHQQNKKESLGDGYGENSEGAAANVQDSLTSEGDKAEPDQSNRDPNDGDIDNNLPSTVILLTTPGGSKVYVVGTVHYSLKSQEDVAKLIKAVQPDCVVLELCKTRSVMLQWDEETVLKQAQSLSFSEAMKKSFQMGVFEGLFYITVFALSVRITKELGIAPGGEFRVAYKEAMEIPHCKVMFGDRPIGLTIKRLFASLSLWQVLELMSLILFKNQKMSQEEVEKYREMDEVEKMLLQFSKESPDIARVLVTERDAVLAYSMQVVAERGEPNTVVGVVGLGHLHGIKEHWGKVSTEQIAEIMVIPPPRRYQKVIKFTIRFATVGLIMYGVHKIASKSTLYRDLFKSLFPTLS